jgi:hydrogenase maturation protein HypF
LAHLYSAGIDWESHLPPVSHCTQPELDILHQQLAQNINCLPTSSMGRLFDAAASLIGIRQEVNYEAQAAIELEALADEKEKGSYPFDIQNGIFDPTPLFNALILDLRGQLSRSMIAARFHNSIVQMVNEICHRIRNDTGSNSVALSGGVWQNRFLLNQAEQQLKAAGFNVMLHAQVPTNDGGISLGQALIAARTLSLFRQG